MSPLPASLVSANRAGIRGSYLRVLVELHDSWLTGEDYRQVAPWKIADDLGMDRSNVYAALDELVRLGFLAEGERSGNARTFKISEPKARAA